MIRVSVTGTDKLLAALNKAEKKLQDGVNRAMDAAVLDINDKQIAATPVDKGILRAGNRYDITRPLTKRIFNNVEYAPYQEFGTGGLVNVPQGLEGEAELFRGKGIRQVNMNPQPFFYRPYFEEIPKLLKAVENILK
jgi:HK97 gp10 family phage protein